MKNYTQLQKIPIERIWKKFEIISEGFSEILKNVFKKQQHSSLSFLRKLPRNNAEI